MSLRRLLVVYVTTGGDGVLHNVVDLLIDSIHLVIIRRGDILLQIATELEAYCYSHLLIHKPEEEFRENTQTNKGNGQKNKVTSTNQKAIQKQRCHSLVDDSANGSFAPYGATAQFVFRFHQRMVINVKWIALGLICLLLVVGEIVR